MKKNVLVLGDLIIDKYYHCSRRGLSAETPTIVGKFEKEEVFLGGAGLVVRNLVRLGNNVVFVSPTDWDIEHMINSPDKFSNAEIARTVFTSYSGGVDFCPTEKIRFFVEGYKLFQMDKMSNAEIIDHDRLYQSFLSNIDWADAVVISDNRHGMMKESFIENVMRVSTGKNKPVYVDSQVSQERSNHHLYAGCDFMFLNENELRVLSEIYDEDAFQLSYHFDCNLVLKMGKNGAELVKKDGKGYAVNGLKVNTVDTCGAGDAFLAAFVSSDDIEFANRWAALSTTKIGTFVPSLSELDSL